jgi:hypothetical protein
MSDLIYLAVAILLPIAPAYLLYKVLPSQTTVENKGLASQTTVEGPWKGLFIKLSGAFAGYFLVFLAAMSFVMTRSQPPTARYEIWDVKGRINWDQNSGEADPQHVRLKLFPASYEVHGDGSFDIKVASEVADTGARTFPTLFIEYPGFQTISIDLNESQGKFGQQVKSLLRDAAARRIAVSDAIELKKKPQLPRYDPSNLPPQQVVLPTQPEQAALSTQEVKQ